LFVEAKTKRHKSADSSSGSSPVRETFSTAREFVAKLTIPSALTPVSGDGLSDTVIVRLGTQNRMVTKGYRKGVYDRVPLKTKAKRAVQRVGPPFSGGRTRGTRVTNQAAVFRLRPLPSLARSFCDQLRLGASFASFSLSAVATVS
jgi:hypothetical protein